MKFKIETTDEEYTFNFLVYYKKSFFSRWQKLKGKIGYENLDKCIEDIEKFLIANEKIDNINKEVKERERRKDR